MSTWYQAPSLTFVWVALTLIVPEPMSSRRYRLPSSNSTAKKSTCARAQLFRNWDIMIQRLGMHEDSSRANQLAHQIPHQIAHQTALSCIIITVNTTRLLIDRRSLGELHLLLTESKQSRASHCQSWSQQNCWVLSQNYRHKPFRQDTVPCFY